MKKPRKLRGCPPLFYTDKYYQIRVRDIVNIVRDNQPIQQGRLLRMIGKRHLLKSKSNAERFLKQMVAKHLIATVVRGKNRVYYYVPEVEEIDVAAIEGIMRSRLAILEGEVSRLKLEYAASPVSEKWTFVSCMLAMAFEGIKECSLLLVHGDDVSGNKYAVEELDFKATIKEIVSLVKTDKDATLVFPLVRPVLTHHHAPREIATRELPYYPSKRRKKRDSQSEPI